jgi:hypothetical protein
MAKKPSMNIFEAHVEKIAIAMALAILGGVIFLRFVSPPAIETSDGKRKASEAARLGRQLAEAAVQKIKVPDKNLPAPYKEKSSELFSQIQPVEVTKVPLAPPYQRGYIQIEDIRQYKLAAIPELKAAKIALTHDQAWVPAGAAQDTLGNTLQSRAQMKLQDVDFVTVEATFPMAQLYKLFEQSFTAPNIEKPLEKFASPVVAMVQLERQQLLPDGTWGPFAGVTRLKTDSIATLERTPHEIAELSIAAFQAVIEDQQSYRAQLGLLQPAPYQLANGTWLPPTKKQEQDAANRASRRTGTTANTTNPAAAPGRPAGADMPRGAMPDMPRGGMLDMPRGATPGMLSSDTPGMMPGMPPGMMPSDNQNRDSESRGLSASERADLAKEELTLWAHDGTVTPGGVYRYRMQIGFFNPVSDTDWLGPDQQDLKYQRILWSNFVAPDNVVKVPPRTVFFPKPTTGVIIETSVRVEVCHYQNGKWYRSKPFSVVPGSSIGSLQKEKVAGDSGLGGVVQENLEIDYRTGITVIDIIPNCKHVYDNPRPDEVVCTDMVYRDTDGTIKRLGTYKQCWPEEMFRLQSTISKALNEQKDASKPQTTPGGDMPGGMPPGGMPPGGMPGMPGGR